MNYSEHFVVYYEALNALQTKPQKKEKKKKSHRTATEKQLTETFNNEPDVPILEQSESGNHSSKILPYENVEFWRNMKDNAKERKRKQKNKSEPIEEIDTIMLIAEVSIMLLRSLIMLCFSNSISGKVQLTSTEIEEIFSTHLDTLFGPLTDGVTVPDQLKNIKTTKGSIGRLSGSFCDHLTKLAIKRLVMRYQTLLHYPTKINLAYYAYRFVIIWIIKQTIKLLFWNIITQPFWFLKKGLWVLANPLKCIKLILNYKNETFTSNIAQRVKEKNRDSAFQEFNIIAVQLENDSNSNSDALQTAIKQLCSHTSSKFHFGEYIKEAIDKGGSSLQFVKLLSADALTVKPVAFSGVTSKNNFNYSDDQLNESDTNISTIASGLVLDILDEFVDEITLLEDVMPDFLGYLPFFDYKINLKFTQTKNPISLGNCLLYRGILDSILPDVNYQLFETYCENSIDRGDKEIQFILNSTNLHEIQVDDGVISTMKDHYSKTVKELKYVSQLISKAREEKVPNFTMMMGFSFLYCEKSKNHQLFINTTEKYRNLTRPLLLAVARYFNGTTKTATFPIVVPLLQILPHNQKIHKYIFDFTRDMILSPEIAIRSVSPAVQDLMRKKAYDINSQLIDIWYDGLSPSLYTKDGKDIWKKKLSQKKDAESLKRLGCIDKAFSAFSKIQIKSRDLDKDEVDALFIWIGSKHAVCTEAVISVECHHSNIVSISFREASNTVIPVKNQNGEDITVGRYKRPRVYPCKKYCQLFSSAYAIWGELNRGLSLENYTNKMDIHPFPDDEKFLKLIQQKR